MINDKAFMVRTIRIYKGIGLKEAIKIYNEMTNEEKQLFLEKIAKHTINY